MKKLNILILIFLVCSMKALGTGILTPFTEWTIRDVKPGKKYSVKEIHGKPVKVKNTGENKTTIEIEVVKSSESELKEGYEKIPDVKWLNIIDKKFDIEPNKWGRTNLILEVPKKKKYYGKKYQAYLLIKTAGKSKVQACLKSKILISVEKKKGVIKRIWRKMWK